MGRVIGYLIVGLISVAMTGAVALHVFDIARNIEADLHRQTVLKLKESGPVWASVRVDGRDAILSGRALLEPERRAASSKASEAIEAIAGVREVRDNTFAQFDSMAALQQVLIDACESAAVKLPGKWLNCAVRGRTVILTGAAMTETQRKNGAEKVFIAVEAMKAQERITDKTIAHYKSPEAMRARFIEVCDKVVAGFTLNWLKCDVDERKFILGGEAPVEAERKERVEQAKAILRAVKGVEQIVDQTGALPAVQSENVCQTLIDDLQKVRKIQFADDKVTIDAGSYKLLDALTIAIKRCFGLKIEIQGHTADTGDADTNRKLSKTRAQAVAGYLIKRGVSADQITANGYGGSTPLASNDTEEGREKNRRIDFAVSR